MNRWHLSSLASLALLAPFAPAVAHHGTAGSYDQTKTLKITGVVKEFRWRNPHSALFVDAKDESGKLVTYALEMGSPQTLVKFGYTRTTFKPGDTLVVQIHPSFTNSTSGEALSRLVVINGKEVKQLSTEDQGY